MKKIIRAFGHRYLDFNALGSDSSETESYGSKHCNSGTRHGQLNDNEALQIMDPGLLAERIKALQYCCAGTPGKRDPDTTGNKWIEMPLILKKCVQDGSRNR